MVTQVTRPYSPVADGTKPQSPEGSAGHAGSNPEPAGKERQEVEVRIVPPGTTPTMKAKIVEADDKGRPLILRQQDPAAVGGVRTIVSQEDGTCRAFGEAIVDSLLRQEEAKVMSWLSSMDGRNLRGLVNELSERFYEMQNRLSSCKAELEEKKRRRGLELFDLPTDCSEKDLEAAYRRLARSMHPDKNGGTEEAKEQFQTMRASYEDLKEQLETQSGKAGGAGPEATEGTSTEEAKSQEPGESQTKEEEVFYCRSQDASALQRAAWKILQKMKVLQQNVSMVQRDLSARDSS